MDDEPLDLSMKTVVKKEGPDNSRISDADSHISESEIERHRQFLSGLSNERQLCTCPRYFEHGERREVAMASQDRQTEFDFTSRVNTSNRFCKRRASEPSNCLNEQLGQSAGDQTLSRCFVADLESPRGDAALDISHDSMILETPDQQFHSKAEYSRDTSTIQRGRTDMNNLTRLLQSPVSILPENTNPPTTIKQEVDDRKTLVVDKPSESSNSTEKVDHFSETNVSPEFDSDAQTPENLRIPALDFLMLQFFCQERDDPIIPINHALKERILSGEKKKISLVDLMELQVEASLLPMKT